MSPIKGKHDLEPSSSSTTLLPGRVGWGRGDVFNSTDPHTGTGEGSESGLSSGTGLLGPGSTGSPELDVEGGDTDFLALASDILSGQHGGVGLEISYYSSIEDMSRLTEDSSRSALTFIPPVTREMVSLPERSVMWTKVSLNLDVSRVFDVQKSGSKLTRQRCGQHQRQAHPPGSGVQERRRFPFRF
jgi:hypothetical protein